MGSVSASFAAFANTTVARRSPPSALAHQPAAQASAPMTVSSVSAYGTLPSSASLSSGVYEHPNSADPSAFAPSAPIVAYFLTNSKPFMTPILHAVTAFLLSHLAASFSQLVKDRQLLSAEVMREYDRRFVYKHVFASTRDRGVGTSDP